MHGYCTKESAESRRKSVTNILIAFSVLLTPAANWLIKLLSLRVHDVVLVGAVLDWLVSNGISFAVSYVGVYSSLFFFVNHVLWKNVLSKMFMIPNLNGDWVGTLHSNNNGGTFLDMTLHIKQTWTEIRCTATYPHSSSDSTMARVFWKNDYEGRLEFAFFNESQDPDVDKRDYYGFNWFTVREDKMTGFYFTDRTGQDGVTRTAGDMSLTKKHGKIYGFFHKRNRLDAEASSVAGRTDDPMPNAQETMTEN